jgi:hypothetical protein
LSSDDEKVIDEERIEIAEEGELESNSIAQSDSDGKTVERKRIMVCDYCLRKLESFSLCFKCRKKLCEKCSINFRNKIICPQDLRGIFPLSRESFKVLLLVANSIENVSAINKIAKIQKKEVREKLRFLLEAGFVDRHHFWGFCISESGLEALHAYSQVFGGTGDMVQLDEEMKRYVLQKP